MLWGKLLSGLRVSTVLTSFLMWPVLLVCIMPLEFWSIGFLLTIAGYFLIVALSCLTTSLTGLVCSTLFSKTATSLMASYLAIVSLYLAPLAGRYFADTFYRDTPAAEAVVAGSAVSPFAATFSLPLEVERKEPWEDSEAEAAQAAGEPILFFSHLVWAVVYNTALVCAAAVAVPHALARGGLRREPPMNAD